ncbi:hypothetical protein [Streptococcus thermophilus]|uniref:Mobilization protein n=1 Tax=Streptococcus thermophilus TaxID=1308 RepID=A0A8D6UDV4_STRTR|nr:hypothetical protein [Streptococcus thermophilus]CAD0146096.1 Mobilization protein [Streptococcus thermophilus]CAD0146554.1 Mobilization protein [Streptococcus thermophilus]CAD0153543.1 Mobilization protein [Streptococcus thermophilus]
MSKTVSELAQELGLSKQYLNRILSQNNLGRKSGNKKLVSDMDEKALISILESNIGNKKSETKTETEKLVSDMPLTARETREESNIGNQKTETKSETEMETSFRYVREQLEIKGKEVERLHQLLDQSQQLLLNEQKKNQLLLETQNEPANWEKEKSRLESSVSQYRNSYNTASQKASDYYEWGLRAEKFFWIATAIGGVLLVLLLVLGWFFFLGG